MAIHARVHLRNQEGRLWTYHRSSRRQEIGTPDAWWPQGTRHWPVNAIKKQLGVEVMLEYRIELTPDDNGTFLVACPQLPIVATFGESEESARQHAVDAMETALASMIEDGEDIPYPDDAAGIRVRLPLLTAFKVHLYWALRETGITRAELARRLQWNRESVDRLFRLDHRSRLEQIEAAFDVLGRSVNIEVHEAA